MLWEKQGFGIPPCAGKGQEKRSLQESQGKYIVRNLAARSIERINMETNPAQAHPGMTIEPVDKDYILKMIPDEEKNGEAAFVNREIPNPFSNERWFVFHLPADVLTRIELYDGEDEVVPTLMKSMHKGLYLLRIFPTRYPLHDGRYTVKLHHIRSREKMGDAAWPDQHSRLTLSQTIFFRNNIRR